MLSINTNLSSLIAQSSMKTSTDKLNQAIERMTTGLKINHASDNAANYSISTNLTTQLSAYDVAADNVAMGMDLVNYASDIISQMQDKAARLNALSTQARNGTYGTQSLSALNSEASAIMSELMRLYSTAEYNDISLFNRTAYTIAPHLPQAGESGFIDETALISMAAAGESAGIAEGEVVGTTTEAPKAKAEYNGFIEDPTAGKDQAHIGSLTSVTEANGTLTGTEYKVSSVDDLVELARLVNVEGVDTTGKTFYLTADLDLGAYCEANMATGGWTPIGASSKSFKGTFDGNGHVIKNLKIDRETSGHQGLFGYAQSGEIKNVGLEGVNIKGANNVGGLVGGSSSSISNSYAMGTVNGNNYVGGLAGGFGTAIITNCYATGNVNGTSNVGGLVGSTVTNTTVSESYSLANVSGDYNIGGLVGYGHRSAVFSNSFAKGDVVGDHNIGGFLGFGDATCGSVSNCYATGDVTAVSDYAGGLIGKFLVSASITNSYATGNVSGTGDYVGGLVGFSLGSISNSYATGAVSGQGYVGGLVGQSPSSSSSISNSYATGTVSGQGGSVGGLVGNSYSTISNSYATGLVTGQSHVGGLVGRVCAPGGGSTINITDSVSYSKVSGADSASTGSLIGGAMMTSNGTSFGILNISNSQARPIEGMNKIGGAFDYNYNAITFDLSSALAGISDVQLRDITTNLQVGIFGDDSCRINFNTNFEFDLSKIGDIQSVDTFDAIVAFENLLSEKATELGAVQNRLDSALESIEVNINNLTSSRSTIRDADIAEVSSDYIRQQILQQASATLLATANQSPAIALQLI